MAGRHDDVSLEREAGETADASCGLSFSRRLCALAYAPMGTMSPRLAAWMR